MPLVGADDGDLMQRREEEDILREEAAKHGVDFFFLGAVRLVENGGEGREMGVLNVGADTFEQQASVAAKTVRNRLVEYVGNPLEMRTVLGASPYRRIVYSQPFILWFGRQWAPPRAANDPTNLNAHWGTNCCKIYADVVQRGAWP